MKKVNYRLIIAVLCVVSGMVGFTGGVDFITEVADGVVKYSNLAIAAIEGVLAVILGIQTAALETEDIQKNARSIVATEIVKGQAKAALQPTKVPDKVEA